MSRLPLAVTLLWMLLFLPALCTGGALLHACDCGDEIRCQHEDDCPSDPCDAVVLRAESDLGDTVGLTGVLAYAPRGVETRMTPEVVSSMPPGSPARDVLPFPPSDVPLRS